MEIELEQKLKRLAAISAQGYYAERIAAELQYAYRVSECSGKKYHAVIESVCDFVWNAVQQGEPVGKAAVTEAEQRLQPCWAAAKAYTAHCVPHAHIDMNWQWGYQETVSVVIETFRTMLRLMEEYPEFTFAQSQASVYRIAEKYAPELLDEIRRRIHEGRWEVSASTWTECDKNMPSGESLIRQTLYAKRYLSRLLEIPAESLKLDFEPDTFGHSAMLPELLNACGVRYYYHCRGCDYRYVFRWQAPSGKELLVYQEPKWYLGVVDPAGFADYPVFCRDACEGGIHSFLKVFGVGDHGGGPTRRDIERLMDMKTWPCFPTIQFSTYAAFFRELEQERSRLPIVTGELNFVFTGCYSSQSRIKMANRYAEARLFDAETLSSAAACLVNVSSRGEDFAEAWEKVLFSQFHDILPGSGVRETREYCLGGFQDTLACANANANRAMYAIASHINTSKIPWEEQRTTVSEGGGVGLGTDGASGYQLFCAERGRGSTRIFHLFNPTAYQRKETVELSLFDYPQALSDAEMVDSAGNPVRFQVTDLNRTYWRHRYSKLLAEVNLPPLGYGTYILRPRAGASGGQGLMCFAFPRDPRQDHMEDGLPIVLENSRLRAAFHPRTMELISLTDRMSGNEMLDPARPACVLRYAEENNLHGMSAWRVGPYMREEAVNECAAVRVTELRQEPMRQLVRYQMKYRSSEITVTVTLIGENETLNFEILTDWQEIGNSESFVPQLRFAVPVGYPCERYRYDIPFGILERNALGHDVPALSYMELLPDGAPDERHLMLSADSKYAFRGFDRTGCVTLLRSSFAPDPLPESGKSRTCIRLAVVDSAQSAKQIAECCDHPIPYVTGLPHTGELPLTGSPLRINSNGLLLSCVKPGEDGGTVLRFYEVNGKGGQAELIFARPLQNAFLTDGNETPLSELPIAEQTRIAFPYSPNTVVTLRVVFAH